MWDRGDGDLYWLHEHSFHVHYTSRAAPNELIYVFNVRIRQYVSKRLSSRLWLFANSHSPGPILGGAFVNSSATWRSSFYINLLRKSSSCTCVDLLAPFALSSPGFEVPPASNLYRLGRLAVLLGASLSAFIVMSFGRTLFDRSSGPIIILFFCRGVLCHIFRHLAERSHSDGPRAPDLHMRLCDKLGNVHLLRGHGCCQHSQLSTYLFQAIIFSICIRRIRPIGRRISLIICCLFHRSNTFNGLLVSQIGLFMPWCLADRILTVIGALYCIRLRLTMSPLGLTVLACC